MSIFMLSFLGIIAFALYFFQLTGVQTRIVKSLTQQINSTYNTAISIRRASIDVVGNMKLYDFLILDHQKDTLFYAKELITELESIDNFINRNYSFKTIEISAPFLKDKTYPGEEQSSLKQFVDNVKKGNDGTNKAFTLKLDALFLYDGLYKIDNPSQSNEFSLDAEFKKVYYGKNKLQFSLDQLSGNLPYLSKVETLSAEFEKKGDSLTLVDLNVLSDKINAKGNAKLYLPIVRGNAEIESSHMDIHFEVLETKALNFSSSFKALPIDKLKLTDLIIKGPVAELEGFTTAFIGEKTILTTAFTGNFKNTNQYQFKSKDFQISWNKDGLKTFIPVAQQASLPFVLPTKGTINADIEISPNDYNVLFRMNSDAGKIKGDLYVQKLDAEKSWLGKVHTDLENMQFISSKTEVSLSGINASLDFRFQKQVDNPIQLEWQTEIEKLQWNARNLIAVSSSGIKKGEKIQGDFRVNDPTLKAALSFNFDPQKTSTVAGDIKVLNLSEWTIASNDINAVLSTKFTSNFDQNKGVLKFNDLLINSQKNKTIFSPIDFTYQNLGSKKTVVSNGNDALGFSLDGVFDVDDFYDVSRSAFEEVVFFRPHKTQTKETAFSFSVLLKQPLIEALYPEISTPKDLSSKGYISSVEGESYFKMELPLLKVGGSSIEGLKLETSNKNPFFNTFLTALALSYDEFSVGNLNLLIFTSGKNLLVRLEGLYGEYDAPFELNFNHSYQNNTSTFVLKNATISSPKGVWGFNAQKEGSITYDFNERRFEFKDIFALNGKQEIALDGFFKNKESFELDFKANAVQLENLLPPDDKFSLAGDFSANGTLGLNAQNPSNALQIELKNMKVNDTPMGNLFFGVESNSELNAFRLKGNIVKETKPTLTFMGSAFIKAESLNVDVDFDLNQFSISFLSRLGKDKITNLKGDLNGKLNLWGGTSDLRLDGTTEMFDGTFYLPVTNIAYSIADKSEIQFSNTSISMNDILVSERIMNTEGRLNTELQHKNFRGWSLDLDLTSDRFLVYNKKEDPEELFYGQGFLSGVTRLSGPTKSLTLSVNGSTAEGTTLTIPWNEDKGLSDTNYIDFLPKNALYTNPVTAKISDVDEDFRGFEMNFNLDVNQNAEIEIVVDQSSGSTLSGRGVGNILIESNIDGKFNIWGDFITTSGIYNFKNLGLIDKKFKVLQGGTIVWEGDPIEAQMNLEAVYEVPGGANPALLVDNPNFNKKIPTDVKIQLQGNLLKPDDPLFEIEFPNASAIVKSEINYRLADQQRRQLQALSLVSQGVFISDVSLSVQGIANNLYEKASDVFSTLLGSSSGKLNVGVNYLKGDETPFLDTRTEDRIGVTLTTQISDKILFNGKIGVPVGGVEETLIVGDVQIDFILNEDGTLKAKVFNKENEFRYLGDEIGYTQGVGLSYQVDFDNFRELIQKITKDASASKMSSDIMQNAAAVEILNKKY